MSDYIEYKNREKESVAPSVTAPDESEASQEQMLRGMLDLLGGNISGSTTTSSMQAIGSVDDAAVEDPTLDETVIASLKGAQALIRGALEGKDADDHFRVEEQFRPTYEVPSEGWAEVNSSKPRQIAGTYSTSSLGTGGVDLNPQTAGCTRPQCDVTIENDSANAGLLTLSGSSEGFTIPANGVFEIEDLTTTDGVHQVKAESSAIDITVVYTELS